jgi:hypothetical protein
MFKEATPINSGLTLREWLLYIENGFQFHLPLELISFFYQL